MTMNKFEHISERYLQRVVHSLLSDPAVIRTTKQGKRLQILSPGVINTHEGPDFLDLAIMLNSQLIIGDAEFHKKSSDWEKHAHSSDPRYNRVTLHIVLEEDAEIEHNFETLILNADEINLHKEKANKESEDKAEALETLHQYALNRLLRKSADAKKILNQEDFPVAVMSIVRSFIDRYLTMRRRPVYKLGELNSFLENLYSSKLYDFLHILYSDNELYSDDKSDNANKISTEGSTNNEKHSDIPDRLVQLLKDKESGLGANLRREIVLNCALPIALAISGEEARIKLFLWYWSTPALSSYGVLKKHFPNYPQNFLWQQQGMLEYKREHGNKSNETTNNYNYYGLGEILEFYHVGRNPYLYEK